MSDPRSHRRYIERRNTAKRKFQRQRAECWLCNGLLGPIDYEAKAGTPLAFDLDHKVAIASNGSLMDTNNWAPSHARCNRSKGAKDADAYRHAIAKKQIPKPNPTTTW